MSTSCAGNMSYTKLTEDDIAELAEFFDLLAKGDYEDHLRETTQQNGVAGKDDPIRN